MGTDHSNYSLALWELFGQVFFSVFLKGMSCLYLSNIEVFFLMSIGSVLLFLLFASKLTTTVPFLAF